MPWSVASRCRCQSVSVSVGSAQFITWWYAVGSGLGLGLVWSKSKSRPSLPTPGRNPLTRDPWTKHPSPPSLPTPIILAARRVPPVFTPSSLFAPLSLSLLGLDLGDPVTRQAFPHIIKRLCFAAFLGLGLCGLLRLHRPGHLHSPTFSPYPHPHGLPLPGPQHPPTLPWMTTTPAQQRRVRPLF